MQHILFWTRDGNDTIFNLNFIYTGHRRCGIVVNRHPIGLTSFLVERRAIATSLVADPFQAKSLIDLQSPVALHPSDHSSLHGVQALNNM